MEWFSPSLQSPTPLTGILQVSALLDVRQFWIRPFRHNTPHRRLQDSDPAEHSHDRLLGGRDEDVQGNYGEAYTDDP
jgi:hypothetical protein